MEAGGGGGGDYLYTREIHEKSIVSYLSRHSVEKKRNIELLVFYHFVSIV